jgi:hypothetical protein
MKELSLNHREYKLCHYLRPWEEDDKSATISFRKPVTLGSTASDLLWQAPGVQLSTWVGSSTDNFLTEPPLVCFCIYHTKPEVQFPRMLARVPGSGQAAHPWIWSPDVWVFTPPTCPGYLLKSGPGVAKKRIAKYLQCAPLGIQNQEGDVCTYHTIKYRRLREHKDRHLGSHSCTHYISRRIGLQDLYWSHVRGWVKVNPDIFWLSLIPSWPPCRAMCNILTLPCLLLPHLCAPSPMERPLNSQTCQCLRSSGLCTFYSLHQECMPLIFTELVCAHTWDLSSAIPSFKTFSCHSPLHPMLIVCTESYLCTATLLFFRYLVFFKIDWLIDWLIDYVYSVLPACVPAGQKRAPDLIIDGCEPPCDYWEFNSGPLEQQPVLLTTEPLL